MLPFCPAVFSKCMGNSCALAAQHIACRSEAQHQSQKQATEGHSCFSYYYCPSTFAFSFTSTLCVLQLIAFRLHYSEVLLNAGGHAFVDVAQHKLSNKHEHIYYLRILHSLTSTTVEAKWAALHEGRCLRSALALSD